MVAIGLQGRVRRLEATAAEHWQRHRREIVLRLARAAGLTRSVTDAEVDDALRPAEAALVHVLGPRPWPTTLDATTAHRLAAAASMSSEATHRFVARLTATPGDARP
jgi:hypothetical protein